jgi:hypothetical protein
MATINIRNKSAAGRMLAAAVCGVVVLSMKADLGGYATVGHKWGTNQVVYYVNAQNLYVSSSAAISAIQSAASAWKNQSNANINLVYGGTTSGSSLTLNYKNEVFFRNDTVLGAETYWWYDGTGKLVDADIMFHQGQRYFTGMTGCSGAGLYIEDIGTHEFGHALGLAHSSVSTATMRPATEYCSTVQVSLDPDDISGIRYLYPPTSTSTTQAPAAPSGLVVGVSATNPTAALSVSWSDNSSNESGFRLERSSDGASFATIAQLGSNVQSYTNSGLVSGTRYYYRVNAYNSGGNSAYSNTASGVTQVLSLTTSPDGTMVPPATQIVDASSAVWTLGGGGAILRNGLHAAGGYGSKILWASSVIYVYGTDSNWWKWTGSGWTNVGPTQPGSSTTSTSTVSPDGTTVPPATQIKDAAGASWTIGTPNIILRNGTQAAGGLGSQILWYSSTIYVYGTDSNWWKWTGSAWTNVGATKPGGSTSTTTTKPGTPTSPSPANGATGVSTTPTLTWSASSAQTYDVYFGASYPPALYASGVSQSSKAVSSLATSTTYYWSVVARNSAGTTPGPVWSFTTKAPTGNGNGRKSR